MSNSFVNHLIHEKSPYLLQHANNPVGWYPWGDEAFKQADKQNKPVFLSIGYSTCHWCHVMEHESFENNDIAQMINEYFIPVKVDREERPDIDSIYMTAVQAMIGQGGWPLTVFLTPDKKPFYGGTYFPPYAKWGSPGISEIMQSIHQTWTNDPQKVKDSSQKITESLQSYTKQQSQEAELSKDILKEAFDQFSSNYDSVFGGFGRAPKFPSSHNLSFLLRYWYWTKDNEALNMVETTLEKMARGGMYDHLGGGFHRYSVDAYWQVPHFEKMLYDQAILARTYLEAYQITKNEFYADVARQTLDYVLRDMQQPQGGFYSAEDADSFEPSQYKTSSDEERKHLKKIEGAFYLFDFDEIKAVLDPSSLEIFCFYYNFEEKGNILQDPHGEFISKNIAFIKHSYAEVAQQFKISVEEIHQSLEDSRSKLLTYRNQRPRPHLDDKVMTDWNGLMISALSFAARVLDEDKYLQAAKGAADFILKTLINEKQELLHRYRDGDAAILGNIEDYAFFIYGLIHLYEASFEIEYLTKAIDFVDKMIDLFWDSKEGGFFFTSKNAEKLLFRQKEIYDGAIPSGNSIAALVLLKLHQITLNKDYEQKAQDLFHFFAPKIYAHPSAYAQALIAFDYVFNPSKEIVIAVEDKKQKYDRILNIINKRFIPNYVILMYNQEEDSKAIVKIAPFLKNQIPVDGKTTVYMCEDHKCQLPVNDSEEFKSLLEKIKI